MTKLTQEQLSVVHHPLDQHARVLAVAGSGKSTTMAHRIKHLVLEHAVPPATIQVLMFNALARKQFTAHLDKIGLAETQQPLVHTFHSFSFHIINEMVKRGYLPPRHAFWLGDKTGVDLADRQTRHHQAGKGLNVCHPRRLTPKTPSTPSDCGKVP